MNSVSFIRRIDDLGRIVIPKEIRKKLKIRENEVLEIFNDDDRIIVKKHNEIDNNMKVINMYGNIIRKLTNKNIIITNNHNIIYTNSLIKDTFFNKEITDLAIDILNNRTIKEGYEFELIMNVKINNYLIYPLIVNSDVLGLIILFSDEQISDKDRTLLLLVSKILNVCLE